MAAFYYGSCPAEGLLWKCACDGRDLAIYPFYNEWMQNKRYEEIWPLIEVSKGYGWELLENILRATIDLEVTNITAYEDSGSVVPCPVSSMPFRRFIKMLREGLSVAEFYLPGERRRFFPEKLSRKQRIMKFLNYAVPFIWGYIHKEKKIMKTLYGMCQNEHLLWRCSMDRTLSIYYWAGNIMPDESKLPVAWGDAGNTVLDETCMAPIDDVKLTMLELEVKDISYWVDGSAGIKGEKKADYPQSFFHFLNRLMLGDAVSRYIMPDKAIINEFPNATSDSRVRNFLSHAVPIVWKKIIGMKTDLEKCDIAIKHCEKLNRIYGPDPVFSKALAALYRARKEIIHEPLADILDQEYIDKLYARASGAKDDNLERRKTMKTLYGMCENEHLLWRYYSDRAYLLIYYWDGEMPAEDKLPDVWKTTSFDKGRTVPVDGIKNAMNVLKVYNVGFWDSQEAIELGPFSFNEFLVRLKNGATVAYYFMPNGLNVIWPRDMTPTTRVCHFLSFTVPLIWERAKKDELFCDPRESDKKKKTYSDNHDDISKALKKDNVPKATYRITYPHEKITGVRMENNDPVNHPSHYQLHGGMEVIDIIESVTWDLPSDEAYAIGNAIKYICRYRNKGKPVQDLEKAKWYLNRAIEDYKKNEEGD